MIIEKIGEAAMLEQLAEESTELAKAALKKARIIRGENPTPISLDDANDNLQEEYTDVMICAEELGLEKDQMIEDYKHHRFKIRWMEKELTEKSRG